MGGAIHPELSHTCSQVTLINSSAQGLSKVNSERQKQQPGEGKWFLRTQAFRVQLAPCWSSRERQSLGVDKE